VKHGPLPNSSFYAIVN